MGLTPPLFLFEAVGWGLPHHYSCWQTDSRLIV